MAKKKVIKEKESINAIEEKIDTKKEKISTKILIGFVIAVMFGLLVYGLKQLMECGLNNCYLGGAGIGSLIVTIIYLIIDSLKP